MMDEFVWVTATRKTMLFSECDDQHLIDIYRFLESHREGPKPIGLLIELRMRNLHTTDYTQTVVPLPEERFYDDDDDDYDGWDRND